MPAQLGDIEMAATRAAIKSALAIALREQKTLGSTYKSVPGAKKALLELAGSGAFMVAKAGAREWRIQPKQED